ncbi:MAG: hypothetical protein WCO44_12480 [Bacteroidota bacterium]
MDTEIIHKFITDLRVELMEEFDRNFERKAFFDHSWPATKYPNKRGSLMMRTGALRRSIRASSSDHSITFTSSLPYAAIHNDGGEITVTEKMKSFFWAMYYKASGAMQKNVKGAPRNNARNRKMTAEADFWKAMALKKVGSKITIDKRQFIGHHHQVDLLVKRIFEKTMQEHQDFITQHFKK